MYPMTEACETREIRQPAVSERLELEKKRLERRLEEVTAALDALHTNPEIAKTIDAISKLGHF